MNTNCKETKPAIVVQGLLVGHFTGATMDHLPVVTMMAMAMEAIKRVHPEEDLAEGAEEEAVEATEAAEKGPMRTTRP